MMATLSHAQPSPTLAEFKQLLKTRWLRRVACQDDCHNSESHCPDRHFVHVADLEAWWKRTASESTSSESTSQRKVDQLFDEMQLAEQGQLPLGPQRYSDTCLRVLSLLLEHDLGYLIKRFYDSNMHDKFLERGEGYQNLKSNLNRIMPLEAVDEVIQTFHNARWAYCPLDLTLRMDKNLQDTGVIVPFCRKVRLGEGGTASVYWVAVEKALIRDDELRAALSESLITDPDFGECYQMALKSYRGNKEDVYELERNAFSGLNLDSQVPIVRYLGCYAHDHGEGNSSNPAMRKTYNLLLEYGERDLYEYWADETNIPPVRAQEIIRFWESLFEVAKAIRHVHNLEIPRGKAPPRKFNGWHADIKPDNILIVHGQFKLADFGYSKFAPVTDSKNIPTGYIDGFTDTYGAPEVSRAKGPGGTSSEVTQSIDTWSFGCVLSVAATWVVLGFQGVRQYEKLRKLSIANHRDGKIYDRFHNGLEVLPEVRRWHDYLRGHLRCSDTMTPHVLRLVENNMLKVDVHDRLQMTELCSDLETLVQLAKGKIDELSIYSKDTDKTVLRALLEVEDDAQRERSSKPASTPLNPQPVPSIQMDTLKPLQKTSRTERLRSIPLGQTTYRRPIILNELNSNVVIMEDGEKTVGGAHEGATTESPVDDHPVIGPPQSNRESKPRHPLVQSNGQNTHVPRHMAQEQHQAFQPSQGHILPSQDLSNGITVAHDPTPDLSRHPSNISQRPYYQAQLQRNASRHAELTKLHGSQYSPPSNRDSSTRQFGNAADSYAPGMSPINSRPSPPGQDISRNHVTDAFKDTPTTPERPVWINNSPAPLVFHGHASPSSVSGKGYDQADPSRRAAFDHVSYKDLAATAPASSGMVPGDFQPQRTYTNDQEVPWLSKPTPRRSDFIAGQKYGYQPDGEGSMQASPGSPQPDITVTRPFDAEATGSRTAARTSFYAAEKEAVPHEYVYGTESLDAVPGSVFELPYNVCHVRKEIDAEDPKGVRASFMGILGMEKRKADKGLAKTYGRGREIIFVVDNGATMFEHWPILVFVAETLLKRAARLDKSGVDLIFTVAGHHHNKSGLKGEQGEQQFREALDAAEPDNSNSREHQTDLHQTLESIIKKWNAERRPETTVLILTDGAWHGTLQNTVDDTILNLAQEISTNKKHVGKRPFGLQFIRFGEAHHEKLWRLDDELCKKRNLRDIVDHCSWRSTVEKMFKGSIEGQHDEHDPDELQITYPYYALVDLFRRFNDGTTAIDTASHSAFLTPASSYAGPSRSSSTASTSRWRASAPPERRGSQRQESSQSHSRHPMSG